MRELPFNEESFDCVYEHYSMCHLGKQETATAINEIHRVTKSQGLCFLGIISKDSWPKSLYGEEREPGEYWMIEDGEQRRHCMFTDQEADLLVNAWEIVSKEKRVIYLRDAAEQISMKAWMAMYLSDNPDCTEDDWRVRYRQRLNMFNYTHIYYFLRKR